MTEDQELSLESIDRDKPTEVIDLGDAMLETKQQAPSFLHPDCLFGFGTKSGCG